MSEVYNYEYYHNDCGVPYEEPAHWVKFFGAIADRIVEDLQPKTVLDAGCAMGYLVAALRDRGVEAYGVDISEYAISKVREDVRPYCFVGSLTEGLPKGLPKHFDLVTNVEVLEHIYEEDCEKAVTTLCKAADTILFSSSSTDLTEATHVNVQQPEYWVKRFAKHGFYHYLGYNASYLSAAAMLFRRSEDIVRVVEDYERERRQFADRKEQPEAVEGYAAKVYFDCGDGFSEEKNENLPLGEDGSIMARVPLPEGCKAVRFDPVEGMGALVWDLRARTDSTFLQVAEHNGLCMGDVYIFRSTDPHMQFEELPAGARWLELKGEIVPLDQCAWTELVQQAEAVTARMEELNVQIEAQKAELEQEIEAQKADFEQEIEAQRTEFEREVEAQKATLEEIKEEKEEVAQQYATYKAVLEATLDELGTYKAVLQATIDECTGVKQQLAATQNAYHAVADSMFWRVTKPARALFDLTIRFEPMRRAYMGAKYLQQNGVQRTWQAVRARRALPPEGGQNIKFSIVVPLYNTPQAFLQEMIQSVLGQTYRNWELCLADGSDGAHDYVRKTCEQYAQQDVRVRYQKLEHNGGISENSNAGLDMATGDYIGLLDHDDLLAPDALAANAAAIGQTGAEVLYSDEDHVNADGQHVNPFYKPDWSPDLLYSQMYICHFLVFRRGLLADMGGFRPEYDGSQDYDLMLRLSEQTDKICHIPQLLYSWRESESSTAANADSKPYAHGAGLRALDEHLKRKYGYGTYAEETDHLFVYNPRFTYGKRLVSIIIPFKDRWQMTDDCVQSILQNSTYEDYEILLLNNRSEEAETAEWAERIQRQDARVRVVDADMEFNWSKLNNFGASQAKGDVYVFLNNDTEVISGDWLERLSENALRPDVGAVGALLLYPDDTIQHAGVVVGFGGWADHVFKGMRPEHYGSPYVSPMVSRNVMAVTGACMAISRQTMEQVGGFDEEFIICGSDVEWCIRAYENGLVNRYDAHVRLYHYESKSRDSYIPEIDFQKSDAAYGPYRENGDPYYNVNLDNTSVVPKENAAAARPGSFANYLKVRSHVVMAHPMTKQAPVPSGSFAVAEIEPLNARVGEQSEQLRLNLLTPSVDQMDVFGGIATALRFFEKLQEICGCAARIIVTDRQVNEETSVALDGYVVSDSDLDSDEKLQIIPMHDRHGRTIPVCKNDVFVATAWWTAYAVSDVIRWQAKTFDTEYRPLVYMIQDYEPGFYAWSSRYMLAESTYHMGIPVYAVINSGILAETLKRDGYSFARSWQFDPTLNESLRRHLPERGSRIPKKKQILVYGRPSVSRNAFEILIYALKRWCKQQKDAEEWTLFSAGEQHGDVDLGDGMILRSVGKLSLDEYAKMLLDTYAGVSLMVSPHPSYPPLEMAAFGVRTITNCYANKDLASFSKNITSLRTGDPASIADALGNICDGYTGEGRVDAGEGYLAGGTAYEDIAKDIAEDLTALS